ncbi:hypothetical protein GCM10009740_02450 [Terrabacter terrae]|uniref:Uncharacterized protein n=1 Tax=Terrabacter terrae TaxID=318434 RepID=A0ABN2TR57_9MICO
MPRDAADLRRVGRGFMVVMFCALVGIAVGLVAGNSTGNRAVWVPVVVASLGVFFLGLIAGVIVVILVRRKSS